MIKFGGLPRRHSKGRTAETAKRSGVSMVEMVSVLVLFSAAMAVSLSILQRLVTITTRTTTRSLALRETDRFAAIFRADAHTCERVEVSDDGRKLTMLFTGGEQRVFECNDTSIAYQVVAPKSPDSVAANQVLKLDAFLLLPGAKAVFKDDPETQMVTLLLFEETPATPRIQIDAAVAIQDAQEAKNDDAS